jgi:uncharacterized membrane protein YdbT with pleckstrin-like domain
MSYVQSVLQPGEHVRYATNLHWTIYLPGFLLLVLAALVFWFGHTWLTSGATWIWDGLAGLVLACAAVFLFGAWFRRWTTEIAVTDRRIIFKRGFVRRRTIEMHLDKVESVDVDQTILGRIFNYGDIIIRGVGVGIEPLTKVDSPLAFRNHVTAEPLPAPSAPAKTP